jgi:hypothetical protein
VTRDGIDRLAAEYREFSEQRLEFLTASIAMLEINSSNMKQLQARVEEFNMFADARIKLALDHEAMVHSPRVFAIARVALRNLEGTEKTDYEMRQAERDTFDDYAPHISPIQVLVEKLTALIMEPPMWEFLEQQRKDPAVFSADLDQFLRTLRSLTDSSETLAQSAFERLTDIDSLMKDIPVNLKQFAKLVDAQESALTASLDTTATKLGKLLGIDYEANSNKLSEIRTNEANFRFGFNIDFHILLDRNDELIKMKDELRHLLKNNYLALQRELRAEMRDLMGVRWAVGNLLRGIGARLRYFKL